MVSDWVRQTVREFGLSLGLTRFHFNDHNVACVHVENIGSLFIETRAPEVLIYLARQNHWDLPRLERALALVHPDEGLPMNVFCGMHRSSLVFGTCLPENAFTLSTLEQTVETLRDLHDRVG